MPIKKPIKKKVKKSENEIDLTKEVLQHIDKSSIKKQLYSGAYSIGDINLLTEKLKQNPTIVQKIKKRIDDGKFNLHKFMTQLKKELTNKKKISSEKNIPFKKKFPKSKIKIYSSFLVKHNINTNISIKIITLLSRKYEQEEINQIIKNIINIDKQLLEKEKEKFYDRIINELKKGNDHLKLALKRIVDPSLKLEQKKNLIKTLLPIEINKK